MIPKKAAQNLAVIGISTLLICSMLAGIPEVSATNHRPVAPSQTFDVSSNIEVWERAALPLRADLDDAQLTVPNAGWQIEQSGLGPVPIKSSSRVGVYQTNQPITVAFDLSDAYTTTSSTTSFTERDVQLVVAHLREESVDDVPQTFSEALELARGSANANAAFTVIDGQTDPDGDAHFEITAEEPGQYVFFLATKGSETSGFSTEDGDLSVEGNVTIIGVTNALVQEDKSSVSVPSAVSPGQPVDFEVDATEGGVTSQEGIRHVVVLYRESNFTSSTMILDVHGELDENFDLEQDSTVKHSIATVNGIAQNEQPISLLDIDASDGRVSRSVSVGFIFDFIAEKSDASIPSTTVIEPESSLDASSKVVTGPSDYGAVQVETFKNWTPGQYRWIHVAVGSRSSELTTNTGMVTITGSDSSSSSSRLEQDRNNDNDDRNSDVESLDIPRIPGADPIRSETNLLLDGDPDRDGFNVPFDTGIVDEVTIPGDDAPARTLTVQQLNRMPPSDDISDETQVDAVIRAIRVDVPVEVRDRGGTIVFSLTRDELGQHDPDAVRLAVLTEDGWQLLETSPVDTETNPIFFTATTPSFSDFVVTALTESAPTPTESSSMTGDATQGTDSGTSAMPTQTQTSTPEPTEAGVSGPDATGESDASSDRETSGTPLDEPGGLSTGILIGGLVVLVLVLMGGFVVSRRSSD